MRSGVPYVDSLFDVACVATQLLSSRYPWRDGASMTYLYGDVPFWTCCLAGARGCEVSWSGTAGNIKGSRAHGREDSSDFDAQMAPGGPPS